MSPEILSRYWKNSCFLRCNKGRSYIYILPPTPLFHNCYWPPLDHILLIKQDSDQHFSLVLARQIFIHINNSPVESLTGWGTPYRSTCCVASGGAGGRSRVFWQGRTSPGFSLSLFVGLGNATYTRGGAAHGVVSPVAELWHAGRAGMSCAVAWQIMQLNTVTVMFT